MSVFVCVRVYVSMFVRVRVYVSMFVCVRVCLCARAYVSVHVGV